MISDSQWTIFEPQIYHIQKWLQEQDINSTIEQMKKCDIDETQVQVCFRNQWALNQFMELYRQQMSEQLSLYYGEGEEQQQPKFRRVTGLKSDSYETRMWEFRSYEFLNVFLRIYETRLTQMELEYHYKLQKCGNQLRVYFPKNQKISSFFKNEIFEMKSKLNLYHCQQPNVILKVMYSTHFQKVIQSHKIAAVYKKRLNMVQTALFYSNVLSRKQIVQIVNNYLSQHTTILELRDSLIHHQYNKNIFKLIVSFLSETIKRIQKQQDIIVEANMQKCCILIHDRHECFSDAKNEILEQIGEMMSMRFQGKNMRSLFNKVIKNHQVYPYLRVKYSRRSLFCVFSHSIFHSNQKHVTSFCELFKEFFETLNQENHITYYLKNLNYPGFINKVLQLTQSTNITIENFDWLMTDERVKFSKVKLGVKALVGMASVIQTRKLFYKIFLKLMLRYDFVQNIIKYMKITPDSFSNILGLSKPSTIMPNDNYSIMSEEQLKREIAALNSQYREESKSYVKEALQTSISEEKSDYSKEPLQKKRSQEKQPKPKKSKHLQLVYPYKSPLFYPQMQKFWSQGPRESKLQRAMIKAYPQIFGRSKFRAHVLELKIKVQIGEGKELEGNRIYLSTVLQKHNQVSYHLIDGCEFSKVEKQSKVKWVFVFYKLSSQQKYLPSYVIQLMQ